MTRKCLICGASITKVHMGIDACRACAVFYRRAIRSKDKIRCISTGHCEQDGRILECRRCRLDRMRGVFDRTGHPVPRSNKRSKAERKRPSLASQSERCTSQQDEDEPRTASSPTRSTDASPKSTPAIDRIRGAYSVMSRIRKSAELCMRPVEKFVHPSDIDEDSYLIINASHNTHFRSMQILISSLFDFASIAFPEFRTLSRSEKWQVISASYDRVYILESTFRSMKSFPDDDRLFTSFTMTLSSETVEIFFRDSSENVNTKEAIQALRGNIDATAGRSKRAMKKADPTDEEFLAMLALSFWTVETEDERLNEMATSCKSEIMQDLHVYYSTKGVTNYASRIGELFCLLVFNERVTSLILKDMDLFRLMGFLHRPPMMF